MKHDLTLQEFLERIALTPDQYKMALRCSVIRPTVFLRRFVKDRMINGFTVNILMMWQANIDTQIILTPYAAAMYVASEADDSIMYDATYMAAAYGLKLNWESMLARHSMSILALNPLTILSLTVRCHSMKMKIKTQQGLTKMMNKDMTYMRLP